MRVEEDSKGRGVCQNQMKDQDSFLQWEMEQEEKVHFGMDEEGRVHLGMDKDEGQRG